MTNPACSAFRSEFSAHLYDEDAPAERRALEEHLAGCAACREALEGLRATVRDLDRWKLARVAEDPRAIAAAARAAASQAPARPRRSPKPGRIAALAAAAVLLFLCALGSELSLGRGEVVLRLSLPAWTGLGGGPGLPVTAQAVVDEPRVREIAEESARGEWSRLSDDQAHLWLDYAEAQDRERTRLVQALDTARAEDRRRFLELVDSVAAKSVQESRRTRDALVELASLVASPSPTSTPR